MGEPCFWACGAYIGDLPEDHGIYCPYHRPKPLPEGVHLDDNGVWHWEAPNLAKAEPIAEREAYSE